MTTPITSVGAAPSAATATAGGAASSATDNSGALTFTQNFDTFLTLLTTQLKNQDPLSPMDSSQFTQQLVSFSEVEQQIKTNSELSTLINSQSTAETIQALPLVGRTIQYTGNQTVLQNGQATFSYTLPRDAKQASIIIQDGGGNTVFTTSANTKAGPHAFSWNGQTTSGTQQPDGGTYSVQILATDAAGKPITATTTAIGTVTGVSVANNTATFDISGIQVPMSQLITIIQPATATN